MPDLRADSIHAFWDSYDRRILYRVIMSLERVESAWAVDKIPQVEAALLKLGEAIDEADDFDLSDPAKLVRVLAQTRSGRAMRIMQALEMTKSGTASKLLMYAEESTKETSHQPKDKHAKLFLRRNMVFERLQLLTRVFAPNRMSLILSALEEIDVSG